MAGKRKQEGYLLIDHRNSPGVPPELMVGMGLDPNAGRGVYESPTVTCCHCGTVVVLNPARTRPRGYCSKCDSYVCDSPACSAECKPLSKTLDDLQAQIEKGAHLLGG